MGYIYLRKNLTNGKCYVGQAKDIKTRNNEWNCLKKEYGGYVINNARKKYGTDGFSFELLKECPNEEMNYWEMYYIKEYNTKKPYGYNSTDGGDSAYEITDETKAKIAAALRGRKHSPEHNAKVAAAKRGKKRSEETKLKIAAALRGKYNTKCSKAVQALNPKTLEVVYEFSSTAEAQRQGFYSSAVSQCCRNCFTRPGNNAYKGYIWRYAEK